MLKRVQLKVLQHAGINALTRLEVFNAVVLLLHLYNYETWTSYCRNVKQLLSVDHHENPLSGPNHQTDIPGESKIHMPCSHDSKVRLVM